MSIEKRQKERRRARHEAARAEWEAGLPQRQAARRALVRSLQEGDAGGTAKAVLEVIWRAVK